MIGRALLYALSAVLAAKLGLEVSRLVLRAFEPVTAVLAPCVAQDGQRCYQPGR